MLAAAERQARGETGEVEGGARLARPQRRETPAAAEPWGAGAEDAGVAKHYPRQSDKFLVIYDLTNLLSM
jgi:hypothetical protein